MVILRNTVVRIMALYTAVMFALDAVGAPIDAIRGASMAIAGYATYALYREMEPSAKSAGAAALYAGAIVFTTGLAYGFWVYFLTMGHSVPWWLWHYAWGSWWIGVGVIAVAVPVFIYEAALERFERQIYAEEEIVVIQPAQPQYPAPPQQPSAEQPPAPAETQQSAEQQTPPAPQAVPPLPADQQPPAPPAVQQPQIVARRRRRVVEI